MIDPVPGAVEGYITPRELEHTMALYAGEITFLDKWVGLLLDRVRDLGLWDNTLLMLTSDHGEPFGEHGYVRKARPFNYEELVHIPWIVRHPEGIGAGRRIDSLVQTTDMMPTILEALSIRGPFGQNSGRPGVQGSADPVRLHGFSLLPLMRNEVDRVRGYALSGHHVGQWAIRDSEWTYLMPLDSGVVPELYYRPDDATEQHNVIDDFRQVAGRLELELRRQVAAM